MGRGIVAAVALLGAASGLPASAAPSKTVVYEVVRTSRGPESSRVYVVDTAPDGYDVLMAAELDPLSSGGYHSWHTYVSMTGEGTGTRITAPLTLRGGRRFVVGGVRGRFRVYTLSREWTVREIGTGFRYVTADPGDRRDVAGVPYEEFDHATAPGGRYGSDAAAVVPCRIGTGEWSLGNDVDGPIREHTCMATPEDVAQTRHAVRWTVAGSVTGIAEWPYRLAVLDHPKR